MSPSRFAIFSHLILLLATSGLAVGDGNQAPSVDWTSDFEAAREQAAFERRPILLNFYATWCGWCRRLEKETLADPKVQTRAENLVAVRINGPKRPDLLQRFGVVSYPTTVFLSPSGDLTASVRGFQKVDRFLGILNRALDTSAEEFVLGQRLKDHPDLVSLRHDLARLLLQRGAVPEALEHLDSLAVYEKNLPGEKRWQFHFDRGYALYLAGRHREARDELEDYLRQDGLPESAEAIFIYAETFFAEGKRREAREWYRRVLEERTDGWLAEQSRARLAEAG